jgi:hypothetical protein
MFLILKLPLLFCLLEEAKLLVLDRAQYQKNLSSLQQQSYQWQVLFLSRKNLTKAQSNQLKNQKCLPVPQ